MTGRRGTRRVVGRHTIVPALVATVGLAGCSPAGGREATGSATRTTGAAEAAGATVASGDPAARAQPDRTLWTVKLKPFGQPVVYGSVVVVTTSEKGRLYVRGFRLDDGEPIWRTEITPSLAPPGMAAGFQTVHDAEGRQYVALYAPSYQPFRAVLQVIAPASGGVKARAPSGFFNAPPGECPSGRDVCVGYAGPGDKYTPYRLRIGSKSFTRDRTGPPPGSLRVGPGLFMLDQRRPTERLVHAAEGTRRWTRKVGVLFPAGSTTANGWGLYLDPGRGMYFGQMGGDSKYLRTLPGGRRVVTDARALATAGFEEETGRSAWQQPKTTLCVIAMPSAGSKVPYPVRCRFAGRFVHDEFRLGEQVLEGFDVRTGRTTWSLATDVSRPLALGDFSLPVLSRMARIVPSRDEGPLVVDLGTGTTVPASDLSTAAACLTGTSVKYKKSEAFPVSGRAPIRERRGGAVARPCDAEGEDSTAPFAFRTVAAVGSQNDDGTVAVLSTSSSLVAVSAS